MKPDGRKTSIQSMTLREVQLNPHLLDSAGVTTLAHLAHQAEFYEPHGDDLSMMHIDTVLTARGPDEYELFRREYMRLLPEYHGRAKRGSEACLPRAGEDWEYQIRPGHWIPCQIIEAQLYKGGYRYLARYTDYKGNPKTGLIDHFNLRLPDPQLNRRLRSEL